MSKFALIPFLLLIAITAMGQGRPPVKKSLVILQRSKSTDGIKVGGKDVIKVYQGVFKQDYSTLTSDSAYFYAQDNLVDAFGHVVINQGDTLHIYSDKLHYDGNTKVAVLTDHVKMVDKDAVLTTNHLTYNTATRIATYTDGGKLVNKDNTLLSKNGYYFAFSRDSYFRYNVSLTTPDALVITDTMRYNTGSRIAYFYGPTHIYSTKGEKKDRDTLYTENGNYNTVNEQAAFGKNNLYNSGTKSLKGDSLFYDKIKGYGRAVKRVTFIDLEQKITIKGNLGTYFKPEERTVVTEDPYVIIITEQKDTSKTDSAAKADSALKKMPPGKNKMAMTMTGVLKNIIPAKMDSVVVNKDVPLKADSIIKVVAANKDIKKLIPSPKNTQGPSKTKTAAKTDTKTKTPVKVISIRDTSRIKRDSIYISADTIETFIKTYKDLKIYQEQMRLARIRDTTIKGKAKPKEKPSKFLTAVHAGVTIIDTTYLHTAFFGKPKPTPKKPVKAPSKKQIEQDSIRKKMFADSVIAAKKLEPADTARIRVLFAYHHAKLFKSDMQAKADSMFYSNSDSTFRLYDKPIIWTEGSQLSGDTIHLQMKHKKMDNMVMFPNAFIVNIEKTDSVHFNQVGGKLMRGYFKDDKLSRMYIAGNAESIYYTRDSGKMTISGMERSLASKMWIDFKNNAVTRIGFYTKPSDTYGPLNKFKDDDKILKGFIWKPKERPVSKESIIPSYYNKKTSTAKSPPGKGTGKPPAKKPPGSKDAKGKPLTGPLQTPGLKTVRDSTLKVDSLKLKTIKVDTVKAPVIKVGKDTVKGKPTAKAAPVM